MGDREVWAPDEEGYGYPSDTGPEGRIARIIDDEDLDPETGARKGHARKAAGALAAMRGRKSAPRVRRPILDIDAAMDTGPSGASDRGAHARRRHRERERDAAGGTGFIPDEDLHPDSRPGYVDPAVDRKAKAKAAARAKMQANMAQAVNKARAKRWAREDEMAAFRAEEEADRENWP